VVLSVDKIPTARKNIQVAYFTTPVNAGLRPEVQKAMQALREMPPFARQREIETGRYSHFSAEEREMLKQVH
jgi:hypothetical protein